MDEIAIVVHGGAGGLPRDEDRLERMRAGAATAVEAGHRVLAAGGAALDAVEAAVVVLEDDPEFNAGRGAVVHWFTDVHLNPIASHSFEDVYLPRRVPFEQARQNNFNR